VTIEQSRGHESKELSHGPVRQAQLQSPHLKHQMSPMHIVEDHRQPAVEADFRGFIVAAGGDHDQIGSVTGSGVENRPNRSQHWTVWPPKTFHAHQPILAIRRLVERVVFDESEHVRNQAGQDDVGEFVGTNPHAGEPGASHFG